MKKIKKLWNENRILIILAIILIGCILTIGIVSLVYFYGSSDTPYGNRLSETENVKMDKTRLKSLEDELTSNEKISSASLTLEGKIVYLTINFESNTKLESAKKIAEESVTKFSEEELGVYDIMYTIKAKSSDKFEGYILMGAKNASGSDKIIWSNNTKEEKKEGSND